MLQVLQIGYLRRNFTEKSVRGQVEDGEFREEEEGRTERALREQIGIERENKVTRPSRHVTPTQSQCRVKGFYEARR